MRGAGAVVTGLLLAACVRAGFDPDPGPADAAPPDGRRADGAADAGTVDVPRVDAPAVDGAGGDAGPELPTFGAPEPIPGVNSDGHDKGPFLSADGLRLYFSANRAGGNGGDDIWVAARSRVDLPFGGPALLAGVNEGGDEEDPSLTGDELLIVFEREHTAEPGLYQATRTSPGASFGAPQLLPGIAQSTDEQDLDPEISPDGLTLIFAAATGRASREIWQARRASRGDRFGDFAVLETLASPSTETGPGLGWPHFVVFGSDRPGGRGEIDLYLAMRSDPGQVYQAPVHLAGLSSSRKDDKPSLHLGLRLLVFETARGTSVDLYWSRY